MLHLLVSMTKMNQRRSNSALWIGLLLILLAIVSNFFYFLKPFQSIPQAILPWVNLALPAVGVLFLLIGVKRAFGQSQLYSGKIWGSIVAGISVLLFAGAVWAHVHSRAVPRSTGAPQVGQRIPDFTLQDSNGHPVSLAQLFAPMEEKPTPPKALLLIFYRGYW